MRHFKYCISLILFCLSFSKFTNAQCSKWEKEFAPWLCDRPGPGFPGNPNPLPLPPVTVTPRPDPPSIFPGTPGVPLPPPGSGWGGGSARSVSDITDKLTTPCFSAVFSEVKSKTLQNTISKMLNKLFGSTDIINLDILERNLNAGVDADTRNAGSSGAFQRVEVTLNTSELQNASKEYIAATILHEIVHGIFLIKNKNPLIDDHNEMGSYYISIMADALREMYPAVSSDDATALSWGGVHESYGWSEIVRTNTAAANSIIDTNKRYKNGTSGTKCK